MYGQTLKYLRLYYRFGQSDLAKRAGISNGHMSGVETGKSFTFSTLERLLLVFHIRTSSFFALAESLDDGRPSFAMCGTARKVFDWVAETGGDK